MNKLKKFNLATPLGTELITRHGKKVSEWYYFKADKSDYPIQAIINGDRIGYTIDGNYNKEGEHYNDLFIKPQIKECWVNVYIAPDGTLCVGSPYSSEELARTNIYKAQTYIKTIRITDEAE